MKNTLVSVLIIALIAVGGYFLLHSTSETITPPKTVEEEVVKIDQIIDKSLVVEKTYNTPDKYTTFNVSYPQFKNASTEFNKKIEDVVNAGIAQQQKDAGDNWQARYDTQVKGDNIPQFPKEIDKFYFDASWKPVQVNDKYISFIMTVSAYEGGAHGYEAQSSFNYNVEKEKEITLADLFPSDANYLKTISEFSRKDLTAQFRKRLEVKTKADEQNFQDSILPMLTDGTTPTKENFAVFTFTLDEVTIYFSQYQVAPYSMGGSKVVIPRK
ncbi:MAG: DUF3298 domain-containing protein [Candidatus Pacebacteria bacterium]|nr:DUF3298 domain-containing protein [Candidatus Paceibacterota bacterium]